jgi:hypothetical protein
MCVLLCANPTVREWLDVPLAREYRQMLQLNPVCPGETSEPAAVDLDPPAQERVSKRSAWRQAYCRDHLQRAQHGELLAEHSATSLEWQKALEAIAKGWGRLLSLVGLRW